jgi:predicted phosphodiesterase
MNAPAVRRVVIIPDTQLPFENKLQVASLLRFIRAEQPDEIVHVGDLMDYPQPSRWNKGTRGEFEGSVRNDSDQGKRFLSALRKVFDGLVGVHEGNHDLRPRVYFEKYAPALDGYNPFGIDTLLDFAGHGVTLLPAHHQIAPGWISTHGHLGYALNRVAGMTALNAARRIGKSVIMGHTHRAGIVSESYGYEGKLTTLSGMEVGHMMDVSQAGYLKSGWANWQAGFAIITIAGECVTPELIPMQPDGSFVYGRRLWR